LRLVAPLPEQVAGVVVAFHPDPRALEKLLAAARPQLASLVVIDNTPAAAVTPIPGSPGVEHVARGFNAGLAAGLNQGCEWARAHGASFVLMFDQDSVPADDMLDQLIRAWDAAERAGIRVAAAGPRFSDDRGAPVYPFLRLGTLRNKVLVPKPSDAFLRTDVLITSGCLVSLAALDDVGAMDESLFIDNVDLEWGFRARHKGWSLIGAPRAMLDHRIGDEHVQAPWWARLLGKKIAIRHGPSRLYYITRNRIRLYWMRHVPAAWKLQDLLRLPGKILLGLWLAPDRGAAATALARGVADGLADRGGAMR
jgi:rhamnosyltransferase